MSRAGSSRTGSACSGNSGTFRPQGRLKGFRRDATSVAGTSAQGAFLRVQIYKQGTDLVTSRRLGCFRDNALTRQEFLGMAT